jgi:hypothetical protein
MELKFNARTIGATVLTIIILAVSRPAVAANSAPQIWFNMTNYNMPGGVDGPQGWTKLFVDPNVPWPDFMNHVPVVAAAGIAQVPDDVLGKAFEKLKQKHVSFAMESLAQSWVHEPECGHGVESYYDPPGARTVSEKIAAAGGRIDIVAMDEPLYYGRYYAGHDACHSSIENVAERAAAIMREYQKPFPNVVIGDIEPIPALTSQPNWRAEYEAWMQAFSAATGQKIAFLQVDINWRGGTGGPRRADWQQSLHQVISFAQTHHVPVGIVYNADMTPAISSDKEWLDGAVRNIRQIEGAMGITPAQAVFHSWDRFPRRSITDETGLGEDYLVKYYLMQHYR